MLQAIFLLLLIVSAVMQALAIVLMKKAPSLSKEKTDSSKRNRQRPLLIAVSFLLFGLSFPLYVIGLSGINLAIAQPVFSSSMFVSTIVFSVLVFHEKIILPRIAGVVVIIAGIITVISN